MSALAATAPAADAGEKKSIRRRRTPGSSRRPKGEAGAAGAATTAATKVKSVERKPRPESVPVPESMIGSKLTGRVTTVVKKSRLKFGFIHIGALDADEATLPRIYFSFADIVAEGTVIHNKDLVQFECKKDDKGRAFAADISLTPAGKIAHDAKEAEFAAIKAARSEPRERKERAPRERKPQEERNVALNVTCEGKDGVQRLDINVAASVGKAKNVATVAFDAPLTHNVFHVSAANPNGVFLTKTILAAMKADDKIHLRPATEAEVAAAKAAAAAAAVVV